MRRLLPAIGFIALIWFFGGWSGALVAALLLLIRWLRAPRSFFWGLGILCLTGAAGAVLLQGLPSGAATPAFAAAHWLGHAMVGGGLAALSLAIMLEIGAMRRASPGRLPDEPFAEKTP